jgi:outer membrane protein G
MKKTIILLALFAVTSSFAQAFDGYGDSKTSIGVTSQKDAIGLVGHFDKGLNDFLSYGTTLAFVVSSDDPKLAFVDSLGNVTYSEINKSDTFSEKINFNIHLDAHLAEKFGMSDSQDVTAGLNLGFRNIGLQLGYKYMITDNFGFFANAELPVYKFKFVDTTKDYFNYYNQPVFGIGIVIGN